MNNFNIISYLANFKEGESGTFPPIPKPIPPEPINAFYVEDCSGTDNSLSLTKNGGVAPDIQLEYSSNGSTWQEWVNCQTTALPIEPNGRIYLRGTNISFAEKIDARVNNNKFNCSGNYNIGGDITTMLEPNGGILDLTGRDYCFSGLFFMSKTLINTKNLILPSTTLSVGCYLWFFDSCSNLVTSPKVLPATSLVQKCYSNMFSGDYSMITTPSIYATELAEDSLAAMFMDCRKIDKIEINIKFWIKEYTKSWVLDVTPKAKFIKPNELKVGDGLGQIPMDGINGIPLGWEIINK